jgi:hypothetical protein
MKRFFPPPRRMIAISSTASRRSLRRGWGMGRKAHYSGSVGRRGRAKWNLFPKFRVSRRGNILMRAFAFISTQRGDPRRFSNAERILLRFTSHAAAARNNKSLVLFPISVLVLSLTPIGRKAFSYFYDESDAETRQERFDRGRATRTMQSSRVFGFLPHRAEFRDHQREPGRNRRDVTGLSLTSRVLGVGEKPRLDYDHSRKLTTTSLQRQQGRIERCPLVFRPAAVLANEDLERCRLSLETRNLKETKVQSCCSESRISSMADCCPVNGHSFVHSADIVRIKSSETELEAILLDVVERYPRADINAGWYK